MNIYKYIQNQHVVHEVQTGTYYFFYKNEQTWIIIIIKKLFSGEKINFMIWQYL